MRFVVFFASVLAAVVAIAALDWWVDPFADRYDGAALGAALASPEQCFVSHAVVGERTWPDLKLDLFRRREATTVVVGTSRVWKLGAHRGERGFANLSLPGMRVDDLLPLFQQLHELDARPLTVYLGAESMWFAQRQLGPRLFKRSLRDDVEQLVSDETFRATLATLRRAPGAIRHPRALRPWHVIQAPAGCVVDRDTSVLTGAANAWGPDGTWHWRWELLGQPAERGEPFIVGNHRYLVGDRVQPARLEALERALAYAREHGWRVVGFAPPFSRSSLRTLASDPSTSGLLADFRRSLPGVFERYGFSLLDLSDVGSVPCRDDAFTWRDGAHPDAACSRRLRARLDEAAG